MNELVKDESIIKDEFGILPWEYAPGFWEKLLGNDKVIIDSDFLIFWKKNTECKLKYDEIDSIEIINGKIDIKDKNGVSYKLKLGKKSDSVFKLISKLMAEYAEFNSLICLDKIVIQLGFAYFLKSLKYKGLPYVRAVEILLKTAIDNNFSDIHFEPFDNKIKISYRLNGKLKYISELSKFDYEHFLARMKYLAGCNNQINNKAQEGAFRFEKSDIRFSVFPTDLGERTSIRIIGATKFNSLSSLGWSQENIDNWLKLITSGKGLYLITGSVGSGKTTTMYATLSDLIKESEAPLRVVTIEDPVEAFIDGICQSSFDAKNEESLASAFKHLLRQDPDVIALGEIRDVDSIVEALQAGLSGHLVLATFHAGSPEEAVDRIKLMSSGNEIIMSGLKGILHLKLDYNEKSIIPIPLIKCIDSL